MHLSPNEAREVSELLTKAQNISVSTASITIVRELSCGELRCSKSGKFIKQLDESEIEEFALQFASTETELSQFKYLLRNQVAMDWQLTNPEQLLRKFQFHPVEFFCYASKKLFETRKEKNAPASLKDQYFNQFVTLFDVLAEQDDNKFLYVLNEKLRRLLAMSNNANLPSRISKSIYQYEFHDLADLSKELDEILNAVAKLYSKSTSGPVTQTIINQRRGNYSGDTAMAMTYDREALEMKRKWLKHLSNSDNAFANKVFDTILTSISADKLLMPSNDKNFCDVAVTPAKTERILKTLQRKLQNREAETAKKQKLKAGLDLLADIELDL